MVRPDKNGIEMERKRQYHHGVLRAGREGDHHVRHRERKKVRHQDYERAGDGQRDGE